MQRQLVELVRLRAGFRCEYCHFPERFSGLSFQILDFRRSGEKDIHAFAESRRGRKRRFPTSGPKAAPADASVEQ